MTVTTLARARRRLPAALVAAFAVQTAAALFWAGSAAERIAVVERESRANAEAIERVARLEEQVRAIRDMLARIEWKLDRREGAAPDRAGGQ